MMREYLLDASVKQRDIATAAECSASHSTTKNNKRMRKTVTIPRQMKVRRRNVT
jgi:hypothetical protein